MEGNNIVPTILPVTQTINKRCRILNLIFFQCLWEYLLWNRM